MDELTFHTRLHRPGLILDIGAHDGLLTVPLAALPGSRVLAFEPLPGAMARLRAATTHLPNVTLRAEALGDAPGEGTLSVPVLDGAPQEQWASTAKDYARFSSVGTVAHRVPLITLDSLSLADVSAIKLDAEGAEEAILRGARDTLLRCRPVLSIEVEERHAPGSTRAVPACLAELRYRGFFWLEGLRPLGEFDAPTMQRASPDPAVFTASEPYVFTFFFLPEEAEPAMRTRLDAFAG